MGHRVKANVSSERLEDGSTKISVEFPELQVARFKFVLTFVQRGEELLFVGYTVDPTSIVNANTARTELFELPKDWRPIMKREFALSPADVSQIKLWFMQFAREFSPQAQNATNHVFIAPFSKRYDGEFRLYWVETKKVVQFDRLRMKAHPGVAAWSIKTEIGAPSNDEIPQDQKWASMDREIAACVREGILISIDPNPSAQK